MADERNGGVVRWPDLMQLLDQKASVGDVNAVMVQLQGLRGEIREQFAEAQNRAEEDRRQTRADKRQMLYVFSGFGVTILAALIGTGTFS